MVLGLEVNSSRVIPKEQSPATEIFISVAHELVPVAPLFCAHVFVETKLSRAKRKRKVKFDLFMRLSLVIKSF
jgi:hypothetical protein